MALFSLLGSQSAFPPHGVVCFPACLALWVVSIAVRSFAASVEHTARLDFSAFAALLMGLIAKSSVVSQHVFRLATQQFQVAYRIIQRISVFMVDYLRRRQGPPERGLHDVPVFQGSFCINKDHPVSIGVDMATLKQRTAATSKRFASACTGTESLPSCFTWPSCGRVHIAAVFAYLWFHGMVLSLTSLPDNGIYVNRLGRGASSHYQL